MPIEEIHWDKQDVVTCDERGRATLGSEFADEQVFVYIAETPEVEEVHRPDEEKRRVLSLMASWAIENVEDYHDFDAETGIVRDKYGEEHQSPYSLEGEDG
jgi:hypothetical protein